MLIHYTSQENYEKIIQDGFIKQQEVLMPFLEDNKLVYKPFKMPVSTTKKEKLGCNYISQEVSIFVDETNKLPSQVIQKARYKADLYLDANGELIQEKIPMLSSILYIEDMEKFLKKYIQILDKKNLRYYLVDTLNSFLAKYSNEKEYLVWENIPVERLN